MRPVTCNITLQLLYAYRLSLFLLAFMGLTSPGAASHFQPLPGLFAGQNQTGTSNWQLGGGLYIGGGLFNNADFRQLNEGDLYQLRASDDKNSTAVLIPYGQLQLRPAEAIELQADFFSGLPAGQNQSGPAGLYFSQLYVELALGDFHLRLGRQYFDLAGEGPGYIWQGYLDAARLNLQLARAGTVDLWADFHSLASPSKGQLPAFTFGLPALPNFDGDTSALRAGLLYGSPNLLQASPGKESFLHSRSYLLYARYGASGLPSTELSSAGTAGNQADNDWAAVAGNRLNFSARSKSLQWQAWLDAAFSLGNDYQAFGPVKNEGLALSIGCLAQKQWQNHVLSVGADVNYFSGPAFDSRGNQTSHGFVSFRGQNMGGLLLGQYAGHFPAAIGTAAGIVQNDRAASRSSGSSFLHGSVSLAIYGKITAGSQIWLWQNESQPLAADRFLGTELDFSLDFQVWPKARFFASYGIFWPGPFFSSAGPDPFSPAGFDSFQGFWLGSKTEF